ncbi:Uncharacterised protein [Enterobacter asburiae]|nr:Uncharacterised protein [Enterobacter asburiae]
MGRVRFALSEERTLIQQDHDLMSLTAATTWQMKNKLQKPIYSYAIIIIFQCPESQI